MKGKLPTLLTLCIIDTQAKQWWSLAPQQSDIASGQVQLENRSIHVLRPKDKITIMRDSEWMVQLFSVVHHLQHEINMQCNQKIRRVTVRHHQQEKNQSSQREFQLFEYGLRNDLITANDECDSISLHKFIHAVLSAYNNVCQNLGID